MFSGRIGRQAFAGWRTHGPGIRMYLGNSWQLCRECHSLRLLRTLFQGVLDAGYQGSGNLVFGYFDRFDAGGGLP